MMTLERPADGPGKPEEEAAARNLPILFVDPDPPGRRRKRYQPKHALEQPVRADRTTLWVFLILFLTGGFVAGTTAAFSASTTDSGNTFGSATLSNPAGQTIALASNTLSLGITAFGGFDGAPAVTYGARWRYMWPTGVSTTGSSIGCSPTTSSYTNDLADSATSSTSITYTGLSGFADGRWMCVMAHTAYPATKPAAPAVQWYSQKDNPNQAVQLGHVVQSVNLLDVGGTANRLQQNDKIVITFNQPVDSGSRPTSGMVCARSANERIYVGLASCSSNDPASVSAISLYPTSGVTLSTNGSYNTTWAWSVDGKTLTITLNTNTNVNVNGCAVGTSCFRVRMSKTANPSTALESATVPKRNLCIATDDENFDNGSCEPFATGSF
jgi:hypothetical protein